MAGQGKSLPPKLRRKARQAAGKQPKAAPDAKQNSQTGQQAPSANTNHPSPGLPVRLPGGLLDALPLLQCPLCSQPLRPRGHSLVCRRDHCFDVSAKGYVNFVPGRAPAREYDAASFAKRIKNADCLLSTGFIDTTCAPTSVYVAYNNIPSAHKIIVNMPESGHRGTPATGAKGNAGRHRDDHGRPGHEINQLNENAVSVEGFGYLARRHSGRAIFRLAKPCFPAANWWGHGRKTG